MKTVVLSAIAILFGVYVLFAAFLFVFQEKLIFFPSTNITFTPADVGLNAPDVWFKSGNGNLIHGWYLEQNPDAITILFSHGNAGNISDRVPTMQTFAQMGFNVLLYDYQGYGYSYGSPSKRNILDDGIAAWLFLTNEKGIHPDKILPVGRSLGGAVAAHTAVEKQSKGLVLEETFTSITDVAAHYYPIFPVRWLARVRLDTKDRLKDFGGALLVAHSQADEVIPFRMGRALYESFHGEAFWLEMRGRHSGGYAATGEAYTQAYLEFVAQVYGWQP